jgi:hypothetical protein
MSNRKTHGKPYFIRVSCRFSEGYLGFQRAIQLSSRKAQRPDSGVAVSGM